MFEFPTFQLIVTAVTHVSNLNLDNAGRLVSWLFGMGCLLPLWRLSRSHAVDPWIVGILYLFSPVYLYWGTCFLIETTSLFLCLMWLLALEWCYDEDLGSARHRHAGQRIARSGSATHREAWLDRVAFAALSFRSRRFRWTYVLILGALAAATKITTFLMFAILGVLTGWSFGAVTAAVLPLILAISWNHATDLLKAQNPLSAWVMSSQPAQLRHNFGTLAQRLSLEPWRTLWESVKELL